MMRDRLVIRYIISFIIDVFKLFIFDNNFFNKTFEYLFFLLKNSSFIQNKYYGFNRDYYILNKIIQSSFEFLYILSYRFFLAIN